MKVVLLFKSEIGKVSSTVDKTNACSFHFLHGAGNGIGSYAAAGCFIKNDVETGTAQLQSSIFDAVIGCQTAADYCSDIMSAQVFNNASGKFITKVVVAGTIRMFIGFDAFENLKIIGVGVESGNKFKALSADDSMSRPAQVKIRIAINGRQRRTFRSTEP